MRLMRARQLIEKNKKMLEKHFTESSTNELDQQTVQRLQYEIEQAEMFLSENESTQDWPAGEAHDG